MGTNCAPLVADLFLFCYERDFMLSLSDNNQADIIEVFNSTSRYLDDLLNIDNPYFEQMVGQIYEGGSICNENPFITPSTNALGSYAIGQTKDQSVAVKMVHEILFYLSKFNKLHTF